MALCDALDHAHAQGVVHRDVKPSNVLVPDQPVDRRPELAKLTDFGVARVIGGDSLTLTGDVIGTLAYMAPEQAEGLEAGAAADLYSLALVLYEALTGVNPVRAGDRAQRSARRLARVPAAAAPPAPRPARASSGRAIDLALRPRPRERGTIAELRLRAGGVASSRSATSPGVVDRGAGRAPRPRPTPEPPSARAPGPRRRRQSRRADRRACSATARRRAARRGDRRPLSSHRRAPHWRAAWPAAGCRRRRAAIVAAWLASHALAPSPLAPAAAALIAGWRSLRCRAWAGWR